MSSESFGHNGKVTPVAIVAVAGRNQCVWECRRRQHCKDMSFCQRHGVPSDTVSGGWIVILKIGKLLVTTVEYMFGSTVTPEQISYSHFRQNSYSFHTIQYPDGRLERCKLDELLVKAVH